MCILVFVRMAPGCLNVISISEMRLFVSSLCCGFLCYTFLTQYCILQLLFWMLEAWRFVYINGITRIRYHFDSVTLKGPKLPGVYVSHKGTEGELTRV